MKDKMRLKGGGWRVSAPATNLHFTLAQISFGLAPRKSHADVQIDVNQRLSQLFCAMIATAFHDRNA